MKRNIPALKTKANRAYLKGMQSAELALSKKWFPVELEDDPIADNDLVDYGSQLAEDGTDDLHESVMEPAKAGSYRTIEELNRIAAAIRASRNSTDPAQIRHA